MSDVVNLMPPSPDHVLIGETAAIARFVKLRLDAHQILIGASRIPHLPHHLRAQAMAAAGLAGITLHRVKGAADPLDAEAIGKDLRALCRIVDPLIEAIGDVVADEMNLRPERRKQFKEQLFSALDGNAIYTLEEELPEEMREDRDNG